MIIHDLEHLESISTRTDSGSSRILGQAWSFMAPIIVLIPRVQASSNPSQLTMDFAGMALGGDFATLQVNQWGFVSARFDYPGGRPS